MVGRDPRRRRHARRVKGVREFRLFQHDRHWRGAPDPHTLFIGDVRRDKLKRLRGHVGFRSLCFAMRARRLPRIRLYVSILDNGMRLLQAKGSTS